ncbi:MAG: 5'-methylthioadenosine/adenosylhomocysteine nucleosidase [Flavobacteriales bacterium]|nr:5'-methylthioadenosine/adenosylhomocysteine nucleosidase [Flavobacteriales bacterium]
MINKKNILIFFLGAISFWAYNKFAYPKVEDKIKPHISTIGIIGAMSEEVNILKDAMLLDTIISRAGMDFYKGKIGSENTIIVKSGIGKVNAAMATQLLIDQFDITSLINTGIAGGINDTLNIADIVIAKSLRYHDFDVSSFGYKLGQIPRMDTSIFYSDRMMMAKILKNGRELHYRIGYGNISSGDIFINDFDKKNRIKNIFNSDAVEMESTAIAHVCYLNNIPFVIVRAISDKSNGEAPKQYKKFEKEAAISSATLILKTLR